MSNNRKFEQFYGNEIGLSETDYFTMTIHPGATGIDIGNEITERLGPIYLDIQNAAEAGGEVSDIAEALTKAIKQIYKVFPGAQLQAMAKRLLKHTRVHQGEDNQGKPIVKDFGKDSDFSDYFAGNYAALGPLMKKSIEVNGFLSLDVSVLVLERQKKTETADEEVENQETDT